MTSHLTCAEAPVAPAQPGASEVEPVAAEPAVRRPWVAPSACAVELAHEVTAYAGRR
ncbi:hypothetical protein ACFW1A_18655 [Kitasatospora sp. NPDC058965]|uniref:hypothetical protein n=1 Tax=Kitasatospora sp. NPDC058965 TaxID=3346682 RepID=UPI00368451BE